MSACVGFVEPPDYEPRIQNQHDVSIDVYQFPFESPDELSFLAEIGSWDVYVFDDLVCTGAGLVALAEGTEVARIDNGYGLCDGDVWKVRPSGPIIGDNGHIDPRP